MPAPAGRASRRPRPTYLALPPLLMEGEPFEGAAILRELPGSLGAVLWKSLRDVSVFVAAPPGERRAAFPDGAAAAREDEIAGAAAEAELWAPLLVIARMAAEPDVVDLARLVNACRAIARWGERRGYGAVQLGFTQAAARLSPENPRLAYAVGRLARDCGEYARGESWLRLAVRLARRTDWHTYTLAYLSLGTLYQQLGNLPAARTLTLRGYRTSVRRRVHALRGTALHNLFAVTAEMLDFRRAHRYARMACEIYGPQHPRFPALAHDVACFWILHGCFEYSSTVIQAVLPLIPDPEDRVFATANLARASAAAGQQDVYESSRAETMSLLTNALPADRFPQAWLNLARADASSCRYDSAESLARRAQQLATDLRHGQIVLESEALLGAISSAQQASRAVPVAALPRTLAGEARELATEILQGLYARAAAAS